MFKKGRPNLTHLSEYSISLSELVKALLSRPKHLWRPTGQFLDRGKLTDTILTCMKWLMPSRSDRISRQVLSTQNIAQRGLRKQACGCVSIFDVGDGYGRVLNTVVHNGIHGHGYTVTGQYLVDKKQIQIWWVESNLKRTL